MNKKKYAGLTYSQVAQKINKKYKNRDNNPMDMRSWEMEMQNLMQRQEAARMKEIAIQSLKNYRKPTNASKYETGGTLKYSGTDPLNPSMFLNPTGSYQDNRFLPQPVAKPAVPDSHLFPNPFQANPLTTPVEAPVRNVADGLTDGIYAPERLPQLPVKPIVSGQVGTRQTPTVPDVDSGIQDRGTGNIFTPLAIGKGMEFAGKVAMLAGGYDKVNPVYNPNEARTEALMADRSIDTQALENQALSQQNVALQNLSDVRSPNVKRALIQNAIQNTLKSIQGTALQQDQINNQYAADYANTLNQLGAQRVQADLLAENLNTQSKGNYQQGVQNILASIGQAGQVLTDHSASKKQFELVGKFLYTKDFTAGDLGNLITKAERGEDITQDDFIQLYTQKGKSENQALKDWEEYRKSLFR